MSLSGRIVELAWKPFPRISMDFTPMGVTSKSGYTRLLTAVDHFTRFVEAWPCAVETALVVVKAFGALTTRYGAPQEIVSDNGSTLVVNIVNNFARELRAKKSVTAPYHHEAKGLVERSNQSIQKMLKVAVEEGHEDEEIQYRPTPQSKSWLAEVEASAEGVTTTEETQRRGEEKRPTLPVSKKMMPSSAFWRTTQTTARAATALPIHRRCARTSLATSTRVSEPPFEAATAADHDPMAAFWMPFTSNKTFKQSPRILTKAKGMYYWTDEGQKVLDGTAGLWCVNAGHCHEHIVGAIQKQAAAMDFAPTFNMGHPLAFEYAHRLCNELMPGRGLDQVFFTMCGSTSVDTALKIALAYHKARGEGGRYRLIGRERAYHGVGFGGISVGGMVPNRRTFGPMLPGVDHLRTTYDREHQAFSKGQPEWGAHLAEDLERLVGLHDASTIAAVIVEPVSGSAGVLVPPHGYLKRLREICDAHGILLIFDEVITAFGRLGKGMGAEYFGVVPDIVTCAKGLTNAAVPAGATFVQKHVYDAFMDTTKAPGMIELFHGYTYSGHPLAMAAGLATLDVYQQEGLFERAAMMAPYWEEALHALKGHPNVIDIRNLGLMGAVELAPRPGKPGQRAFQVFTTALNKGVMVRVTGDTIALSPPLIIEKSQVDQIVGALSQTLHEVA